jgi:uncharacterized protein YegP (UPF0339 family)
LLEGLRKQRRRYFEEHYAEEVARFAEEAFEVYEDDASRWRWQLHAGNRDVLAHSAETYAQKADADAALETFVQWFQRLPTTTVDAQTIPCEVRDLTSTAKTR